MMAQEGERFVMSGSLNMETVPALFNQGLEQLSQGNLTVDFSKAETIDSATVSMLLGWVRAAQSKQRQLSVHGLPENLISLATLYGVADLLPTH
ncbi:MAG: STAS domain-containing protein [Gallionella sp.]|nr:STAS domain-containing protein [Gallionella sp.]MDD4960437.1 STAS domain-containing protein [Gallionella sp.]